MDGGLRHCSADSSHLHCLLSDSCSSSRGFATRFLQTPPRDGCPCVSLVLHLHQVGQGTCTPKLRNMPGKPKKADVETTSAFRLPDGRKVFQPNREVGRAKPLTKTPEALMHFREVKNMPDRSPWPD